MTETAAAQSSGRHFRTAALLLVLLAGLAWLPRIFHPREPMDGHLAPDFKLDVVFNGDALGGGRSLADLRGHPVLLAFWATWCEPCQIEAPILDAAARRWRDQGVLVVGVDTDAQGQGDPLAFARKRGLSYPIVRDAVGEAMRSYAVDRLPTLVAISSEGKVVTMRTGMTSSDEIERLIRSTL